MSPGLWVHRNAGLCRVGLALFVLSICGYGVYSCLGVFLGTFRFDEVYFLHVTWSDFRGYPFEYWGPRLFIDLLKPFWFLFHGDVSAAWGWRLVLLALAFIQVLIIFHLTSFFASRSMRDKWMIQSVATCAVWVILCSFRGYELRPEILPNTFLLFSVFVIFRLVNLERLGRGHWLLILGAGLGLVFGASISNRLVLPGVSFFAAMMAQAFRKQNGNSYYWWGTLLACAVFAGILNLVVYDYFEMVKNASSFQTARVPMSWLQRLRIGGGRFYLPAKGGLLFLMIPMGITVVRTEGIKGLVGRIEPVAGAVGGLLGYYAFLFTVDVCPFEYVRSVEWILIVTALAALFRELHKGSSTWAYGYLGLVAIPVWVICFGAASHLNLQRNTTLTLKGLLKTSSSHKLAAMSDLELVRRMTNDSILDQVRSRAEYGARHPDGIVIVFDMTRHPIAMKDEGSSLLGGWSVMKGDAESIDFGRYQYISLPADASRRMDKWKDQYVRLGDVWIRRE